MYVELDLYISFFHKSTKGEEREKRWGKPFSEKMQFVQLDAILYKNKFMIKRTKKRYLFLLS